MYKRKKKQYYNHNLPDTQEDPELIEYKLLDCATRAPTLYALVDPGTYKMKTK